jgi:hypothetical protein
VGSICLPFFNTKKMAKTYFIDKRAFVNNSTSTIKIENPLNLKTYIESVVDESDGFDSIKVDALSEKTSGSGIAIGDSGDKLGFFGATPVVQVTTGVSAGAFVANTSGIADDTATFAGYTLGQIAAALKAVGILA